MSAAVPPRSVLIVDDSREDRAIVRRMLRETGVAYEIAEAETGGEAIAMVREACPDCVLLDFRLPDMSALDWLDAMSGRTTDDDATEGDTTSPTEARPLPCAVAIVTGLDETSAAAAALVRGAQDYIMKGTLSGHGLQRAIENSIEKFTIQRELAAKSATIELRNRQLELSREQLEANLSELVDATRAKDRFMAVMSHEMRTPLNAVLGYADLLDMNVGGELTVTQRDYVERIRVGSRHLLDLINDVLDVASVDARKLELDLRPVDAAAVAEEVVALLARQAEAKEVLLTLDPPDEVLPLVRADLSRLRQILTNLIGNAIKFTDRGDVVVSCRATDEHVELAVQDTGIGIEREAMPMVFTDFFQADGDLTRRQGGSGLGLAISQRLAQLMGGSIEVDSRIGVGSVFTLSLPVAAVGSEARQEDVDSHEARMHAHRIVTEAADAPPPPRAVVVAYSDNADGLTALSERVFPGVRLVWTTRVDAVPRLVREEDATLVVLDIGCARGAGWNAAHALRDDAALASIPVLLLPSIPTPMPEEASSGLDLGWVTLVPKPFTHDQLTHAVYSAARGTGAGDPDATGIEVLIVDDDPDSRRVASSFLQAAHVRVREVGDGESALAEMRRRLPNVAVLDLMMPVLDGFGVLAAMRADPLLMRVPVVVLSAKSLSQAERRFLARSAVRVLQKGEHRLSDVAALVLRAAAGAGVAE